MPVPHLSPLKTKNTSLAETTCGSLLQELQRIWDEIGESDSEKDKLLLQLEQECLDVYRRKVEQASQYKAGLTQELAEAEMEAANLVSALGEQALFTRSEKPNSTLKEKLLTIKMVLEELRLKREERMEKFTEVQLQIIQIHEEITGSLHSRSSITTFQMDERELTLKKLGELGSQLQELQREKNLRLLKVNDYVHIIHDLSAVMSFDLFKTISKVHTSLGDPINSQSKSINNDTLSRLAGLVHSLKQEKQQRLQKLQDLGSTLFELWNLLDIPVGEQKRFDHVICLISANVDEVSGLGSLAPDVIEQAEIEVKRLGVLKASKIKELVFKKQNELEEIYREVHMETDTDMAQHILTSLIESGNADLSELLSSIDDQITEAKEQALSRKDILDKVEKWALASEEERWLDDYERDQSRYNAGRGAHKNLKHAEKARILVNKIPSLVEVLTAKVKAWQEVKKRVFLYDKVPLLEKLENYTVQRHEREEDKRRSREHKKMQEQLLTEQEVRFGSRPIAVKKPLGQSVNTNSMVTGTVTSRQAVMGLGRQGSPAGKDRKKNSRGGVTVTPVNYIVLAKDDSLSRSRTSSAIITP